MNYENTLIRYNFHNNYMCNVKSLIIKSVASEAQLLVIASRPFG